MEEAYRSLGKKSTAGFADSEQEKWMGVLILTRFQPGDWRYSIEFSQPFQRFFLRGGWKPLKRFCQPEKGGLLGHPVETGCEREH